MYTHVKINNIAYILYTHTHFTISGDAPMSAVCITRNIRIHASAVSPSLPLHEFACTHPHTTIHAQTFRNLRRHSYVINIHHSKYPHPCISCKPLPSLTRICACTPTHSHTHTPTHSHTHTLTTTLTHSQTTTLKHSPHCFVKLSWMLLVS